MKTFRFNLEKYNGTKTRFVCPNCGRKACFVRYIDEAGNYLSENVGRCNHESSCGYHYTPSEYYRDHPDYTNHPDWQPRHRQRELPLQLSPCIIPYEYVTRSVKPLCHSHLTTFLTSIFTNEEVQTIVETYNLGVTKSRDIIYFQLDISGNCRTGKIMKYNPSTGKRIKDPDAKNKINWVHSLLKKSKIIDDKWILTQCLFGEHLLKKYPDKTIALVESEKTALICSILMPEYLWLATGGKSQLSDQRLSVLKGRRVVAFPDIDGYEEWKSKLLPMGFTVSDFLEQVATPEDRDNHIDIADVLIKWKQTAPTPVSTYDLTQSVSLTNFLNKYISPQYHSEISSLIEEFELIPVNARLLPNYH